MSIETIKQGSGQLAAEQCPGQGAAAVQRRVVTGKSAQVGCWLLAGAVLAVVCTYPVTHPVPGPAHVTLPLPPAPAPPRVFILKVVDIIIEYILYLN